MRRLGAHPRSTTASSPAEELAHAPCADLAGRVRGLSSGVIYMAGHFRTFVLVVLGSTPVVLGSTPAPAAMLGHHILHLLGAAVKRRGRSR